MDKKIFVNLLKSKLEKDMIKVAIMAKKINAGRLVTMNYSNKLDWLNEQILISVQLLKILETK